MKHEAEESEWLDRNAWEETLRCKNGHEWITYVWEDDLPSDPDCDICGQPGERVGE